MKVRPWSIGGNPPNPDQITNFDTLAVDINAYLNMDPTWYQANQDLAKQESAKIQGMTSYSTQLGFPTLTGFVEELQAFIDAIINAFLSLIEAIFNVILAAIGIIVEFLIVIWDNVLGPVLGPIINIIVDIANQIINFVSTLIVLTLEFLITLPQVDVFSQVIKHLISGTEENLLNSLLPSVPDQEYLKSSFQEIINPISNILQIFNFFSFPIKELNELTKLIPYKLIFNVIANVMDVFVSKTMSNLFNQLDFNNYSELVETTLPDSSVSGEISSIILPEDTIDVSANVSSNPGNMLNSLNFKPNSEINNYTQNYDPISNVKEKIENENESFNRIVDLISGVSFGFYSLVSGTLGINPPDITRILSDNPNSDDKTLLSSILIASSLINRGATLYVERMHIPSHQMVPTGLIGIGILNLSLTTYQLTLLVADVFAFVADIVSLVISKFIMDHFGNQFSFLYKNAIFAILHSIALFFKTLAEAIYPTGNFSEGSLQHIILYTIYVILGFVSNLYLIGLAIFSIFENPNDLIFVTGTILFGISVFVSFGVILNNFYIFLSL